MSQILNIRDGKIVSGTYPTEWMMPIGEGSPQKVMEQMQVIGPSILSITPGIQTFCDSNDVTTLVSGDTHVMTFSPLLAFSSAFITGVVFGFLPARKAAHLDPVVALAAE